ncbi:MAG TPA: hypothetical protein VKU82_06615 [Planctomycetaceae bacterium]|nr:hypothetical protein [Planctomycetaceae bacterium]
MLALGGMRRVAQEGGMAGSERVLISARFGSRLKTAFLMLSTGDSHTLAGIEASQVFAYYTLLQSGRKQVTSGAMPDTTTAI